MERDEVRGSMEAEAARRRARFEKRLDDRLGNYQDVMTPGEVAEFFRVDPKTIVRWTHKLEGFRTPGGHRRFYKDGIRSITLAKFLKHEVDEDLYSTSEYTKGLQKVQEEKSAVPAQRQRRSRSDDRGAS